MRHDHRATILEPVNVYDSIGRVVVIDVLADAWDAGELAVCVDRRLPGWANPQVDSRPLDIRHYVLLGSCCSEASGELGRRASAVLGLLVPAACGEVAGGVDEFGFGHVLLNP
jgi:hypothetical protein